MKNLFTIILILFTTFLFSQNTDNLPKDKYTAHNKGKIYIYWGGNRGSYTNSDIRFKGSNYDFTVQDAKSHDLPVGWHVDYINPGKMTIPQTNFRLGYYLTDKYNISIGVDHMKYIMKQNQVANVNGVINLPSTEAGSIHNGVYANTPVILNETFLSIEHTDGLNYVNTEFSRVDDLSKIIGLPNTDKFQVNITEGVGIGFLLPRTNAVLLSKKNHDEFHVSGYGVSAKAGLNFTFFKYFFVQTELKGGYINMPNIRTTYDPVDRASQSFYFFESVIALGGIFRI